MAERWNVERVFVSVLLFFPLVCVSVYVGTVQTVFSARMRLPLRLNAEQRGHMDTLAHYLNDPLRLFVTAGVFQALTVSLVTILAMRRVQRVRVRRSSESESVQSK